MKLRNGRYLIFAWDDAGPPRPPFSCVIDSTDDAHYACSRIGAFLVSKPDTWDGMVYDRLEGTWFQQPPIAGQ